MLDNPFLELIGAQLGKWEEGVCEWELEILPHHLNTQGSVQGGVIATLLDVACGYSGSYAGAGAEAVRAATVSLTVHFMSKVSKGGLVARARQIGGGRKVFFAEAELIGEDGVIVATASGSFRRYRLSSQ